MSSTRFSSTSWSLCEVLQLAFEVLALGAVGRRADDHAAAVERRASRSAGAGVRAPCPRGAARRRCPRRSARRPCSGPAIVSSIESRAPFVFSGSLTTCTTISWPGLSRSEILRPPPLPRPRLRRLDARQHDLVDVQEAVLLEADVDERRLEPGQDVVDLALVDVADDRAAAAALDVELSDAVAGRGAGRACLWRRAYATLPAAAGQRVREAAGVPLASSSATRVSARSTLTSTCFFNVIQSFGVGMRRARAGARPPDRAGSRPAVAKRHRPGRRRDRRAARMLSVAVDAPAARHAGAPGGLPVRLRVRAIASAVRLDACLVAQYAALQRC